MDLMRLRQSIAEAIEQYVAGRTKLSELIDWANAQDLEEYSHFPQSLDYWIVQAGLWAIRMMSRSEPQEYRTSPEELQLTLRYLKGEIPFPQERVPASNLGDLKREIADAIEGYMVGRIPLENLLALARSREALLHTLELPVTPDHQMVRYALETVRKLGATEPDERSSMRKELFLAIRYLRGTIRFPPV